MTNYPTPEIAAGMHALIQHVNGVIKAQHTNPYRPPNTVEVESIGASFARVMTREYESYDRNPNDQGRIYSVYCFVAMKDGNTKGMGAVKEGEIFKAAGYKAPAKHARGNIWTDLTKLGEYGPEYLK